MSKKQGEESFRDPLGNIKFLKKILITLIGIFTYRKFFTNNKLELEGMEYLENLPPTNVMFVSNHQTYFADVMAMYHAFSCHKNGNSSIKNPFYLLAPKTKVYYIAAEETMKNSGFLARLFSYTGAVTVKRAWRHKGQDVQRSSDYRAPAKIKKALKSGWVITFPQGTTSHNAPIRKGAANIIKALDPIMVPVEIEGFNIAFDKKGLKYKKKGTALKIKFKQPMQFKRKKSSDEILEILEQQILKTKKVPVVEMQD